MFYIGDDDEVDTHIARVPEAEKEPREVPDVEEGHDIGMAKMEVPRDVQAVSETMREEPMSKETKDEGALREKPNIDEAAQGEPIAQTGVTIEQFPEMLEASMKDPLRHFR